MSDCQSYITELKEEVARCATNANLGLEKEKEDKMVKMIVHALNHRWSGMPVYFMKDTDKRESSKDKATSICNEFNGKNTRELAQKYNVTQSWVYQVIKKKRECK